MNIAVTEKYIGEVPTGLDFDEGIRRLTAFKIETWGLTDQDYTKIGEQFGEPGNSLWYLTEGNYRMMNAPVSVIGLEAATCDFVNLYVYSVEDESVDYDKMIIMEYQDKRFIQYHDGTHVWHDISSFGTDGADVIEVEVRDTPPDELTHIWVDIRGLDPDYSEESIYDPPISRGVVTIRVWNGTEWISYQIDGFMDQDVYDPNRVQKDPFEETNARIQAFMDQYGELIKHAENKLHLIHITDEDRELYNTTKVYRADLNQWVSVGGKLYEELVKHIIEAADIETHVSDAEDAMDDLDVTYKIHTMDGFTFKPKLSTDAEGDTIMIDRTDRATLVFDEEEGAEATLREVDFVIDSDGNTLKVDSVTPETDLKLDALVNVEHHITPEEVAQYEAKADGDHGHEGDTVAVDSELIMDRFTFDEYLDILNSQSEAPKAMAYANGRFMIVGYNTDDIFISDDGGFTWASYKNSAGAKPYKHLEYNAAYNEWFAVADDEDITTIHSLDNGLTWTQTDPLIYVEKGYCAYEGRYVKLEDGLIYQSMDAFNWYPKSLSVISEGKLGNDTVVEAVEYSPKYPGVFVIYTDESGAPGIGIVDLRNCGLKNMVPEVYDHITKISSLAMFNVPPTKKGMFYYGQDDVFTDADGRELPKRQHFHNGNTIYIKTNDMDLEVYKIIDSDKLGTDDYLKGLGLIVSLKAVNNWNAIINRPTSLEGYGIDPEAEGILTQAEWEDTKSEADDVTNMKITVTGWSAEDLSGGAIKFGLDPLENGIYFVEEGTGKKVLVLVEEAKLKHAYQQGGLSANDNIDIPEDLELTTLTPDQVIECTVEDFKLWFYYNTTDGLVFQVDAQDVIESVNSIQQNLEDTVGDLINEQSVYAKGFTNYGLALEYYIDTPGKFTVTDICFNAITHKFVAAGLYTPVGKADAYPAVTISADAVEWSDPIIISMIEPTEIVRIGFFRNIAYGFYTVATEKSVWVSEDGMQWNEEASFMDTVDPCRVISAGNRVYVLHQNRQSICIINAIEDTYEVRSYATPWGDARVIDGCIVNNEWILIAAEDSTTHATTVYYQYIEGDPDDWNEVDAVTSGKYNRIFCDVHENKVILASYDNNMVAYSEDLNSFSEWKVQFQRKTCHMETMINGSETQLHVCMSKLFTILPSSFYSNKHAENYPVMMTGTIVDEELNTTMTDPKNQYYVPAAYGNGVFLVFPTSRTVSGKFGNSGYTLFILNDNTAGRAKNAKIIPELTMVG